MCFLLFFIWLIVITEFINEPCYILCKNRNLFCMLPPSGALFLTNGKFTMMNCLECVTNGFLHKDAKSIDGIRK